MRERIKELRNEMNATINEKTEIEEFIFEFKSELPPYCPYSLKR